MNINAQVKVIEEVKFPGRFYLHNGGIQVYGFNPIQSAKIDYLSALNKIEGDYLWTIGILWGDNSVRVSEIFAYHGIQNGIWPGNPEIDYYQFRNRELVINPRNLTCGDGSIVLGKEENHRRHKKNLIEFLNEPPRFASGDIQHCL